MKRYRVKLSSEDPGTVTLVSRRRLQQNGRILLLSDEAHADGVGAVRGGTGAPAVRGRGQKRLEGRGEAHHSAPDAQKNELKPWCIPPQGSAEFVCAMEDVLEVYQRQYSASNR